MEYNGPNFTGTITVAGSPVVEEVELGFEPGYVEVINVTTGASIQWSNTMPNDSARFINNTGPAVTFETSDGIIVIKKTAGKKNGFSIGVLTGFSDTGAQVLHWRAMRGNHLTA